MKTEKENKIQQDAVMWFNNNYCLKFHQPRWIILSIPNEGEDAFEVKRKKDRGMLPGASDLLIIGPNRYVAFAETKTLTGVISKNQKEFQHRVTELGHDYFVYRSLDQFKEIVKWVMQKYG